MSRKSYRIVSLVVLGLVALTFISVPGPSATVLAQSASPTPTATPVCGPGYDWTPWGGCRPIVQPCPAGKIDINGNGRDDGGDDCQSLDVLPSPNNCVVWPGGQYLSAEGGVTCSLPLSMGGQPLTLMGAVGCIDVTRRPYPRALVNTLTTFTVNGLFSGVQNLSYGQLGWYRINLDRGLWTTEGLYLHERYGHVTTDVLGELAFNTEAVLGGDPHKYPSLNNVRATLVAFIPGLENTFVWTVTGLSGEVVGRGLSGPMEDTFAFSSYPSNRPYPVSLTGPDRNGQNILPALQVRLRSTWQVWLDISWDDFYVDGNNAYVRGVHEGYFFPIGTYYSFRAWDRQQSLDNVGAIYCNAAANGGYMPVPVLEAQSVMVDRE